MNCKSTGIIISEPGIPITMEATDGKPTKYRILQASQKVAGTTGMPIYQVPLEKVVSQGTDITRKYIFGKKKSGVTEKVIMVVGATGAGKTTLINGMFNHILGMEFSDEYRFRLIQEDQSAANQAKSQTQYITAYTIHHQDSYTVPFTLTIIDTPGFGDTTGIEKDQKITKQIHSFFKTTGEGGIDHIDAIGFVTQASLPRLTPTQKYVFDSILSLFGNDIADNIFLLVTFADGQKPPVLAGVKEANLTYTKYYKFNNSAIYAENDKITKAASSDDEDADDDDDNFDNLFWEMGMKSFKRFLTGLSKVQPKSLLLTKEVLDERGRLELHICKIQEDITLGLNKLYQLKVEMGVLKDHAADIDRNKNFKYTVTQDAVVQVDIPVGQHTTTCLTCNRTCHEDCQIPDDANKRGCWAMNSSGNCRICPGGCSWKMHKNLRYLLKIEQETIEKDSEDLRMRYEEAAGKKLTSEQVVRKVCEEFEAIQMKVLHWTDEVRKSLKRLQEIALKPHPLSALEYIDILIQSEKNEARPGWKERMQQLSGVRKNAEYLVSITTEGFDPFKSYKQIVEEERKGGNALEAFAKAGRYLKKVLGGFSTSSKDRKKGANAASVFW